MKTKFSLIGSIVMIVILACCLTVNVYAWFSMSDRGGTMSFQIARVNSEVYFYTAKDSSINGVPNLLTDSDTPEAVPETHEKPEYYKETRYFDFKKMTEAKADIAGQTIESIHLSDFLTSILPTQTFTMKISLVNKGDTKNDIAIRLSDATLTAEQAKLFSVFAMRVVKVENETRLSSDTATTQPEEWCYLYEGLGDVDSDGNTSFTQISVIDNDVILGLDEQTKENEAGSNRIVNVQDYWLQFKMLSYDEYNTLISASGKNFGISTLDEFQTLQGVSFTFDLSVFFEVNSD